MKEMISAIADNDCSGLYMDVDEKTGTVSLPQKDSSYRSGILEALSEKNK